MKLFRHRIIELPKCILDESTGAHIYITPEGQKLRSVTTMLNKTKPTKDKKQLTAWRDKVGNSVAQYIMNTAAIIGTETHRLNENYINMERDSCNYSLLSYAHHKKFIPYLNKIKDVFGVEPKLFSSEMGLAGTADLVAEYEGKISIIDYKTKRSKQKKEWMIEYFIQTAAYAKMWEELTGNPIEQLVILASSEQNTLQEFISEPQNHYNALDQRLILFHD